MAIGVIGVHGKRVRFHAEMASSFGTVIATILHLLILAMNVLDMNLILEDVMRDCAKVTWFKCI